MQKLQKRSRRCAAMLIFALLLTAALPCFAAGFYLDTDERDVVVHDSEKEIVLEVRPEGASADVTYGWYTVDSFGMILDYNVLSSEPTLRLPPIAAEDAGKVFYYKCIGQTNVGNEVSEVYFTCKLEPATATDTATSSSTAQSGTTDKPQPTSSSTVQGGTGQTDKPQPSSAAQNGTGKTDVPAPVSSSQTPAASSSSVPVWVWGVLGAMMACCVALLVAVFVLLGKRSRR